MHRCSLHVNSVVRWRWVLVLHREAKVVATSDSDSLVSKSRCMKWAVWIYFGFEADEEGRPKVQDAVICRLCKKSVSAKGGNTSNLLSHLKVHLPQRHLEVKKANSKPSGKDKDYAKTGKASSRQPSLSNTLQSGHKYEWKSRKWQQLTDAVTYCLAKDMMPIFSVEKEGFVRLLHSLDSQYELPSRKYFSNVAIPKLYAQIWDVISAEIKSAEFLAATTDICGPVKLLSHAYLSYTVHFVGEDWKLESRCLQTLYLPEDHTIPVTILL